MEHPTRPIADEAALEQAVRQYQAELLRYAAGILGNAADAEDAVQTAFLKLCTAAGRLRPTPTCGHCCTASPAIRRWTCCAAPGGRLPHPARSPTGNRRPGNR